MNAPLTAHPTPPYKHTPLFPLGKDQTPYRKIATESVRVERVLGEEILVVPREAVRALAEAAFTDINHLLRPAHLASLKHIVEDPEASDNDKFFAYDFLKNANIAAGGVLPMCQDTGTAIIMGKKGRLIWTDGGDEGALAEGARDAYLKRNLRYSQLAPISMFEEKNTRSNMPAQVEIYAESAGEHDAAYKFLFIVSVPGDAGDTVTRAASAVPQGKGANARHRRLPALSSRHRHRRDVGRDDDEDGQARLLQILRHAAGARLRGRPRFSR
jgi:fumarate hydratase class I